MNIKLLKTRVTITEIAKIEYNDVILNGYILKYEKIN